MLDTLFLLCNAAVVPFWLLLFIAPHATFTRRLVHAPVVPVVLGSVYVVGLVAFGPPPEGGSFDTLEGVRILLGSPGGALVGWVHYLVFDLFVGAWIARDARRLGIRHLFVVPSLFCTLMLGPSGLLLYVATRWLARRKLELAETGS